MSMSPGDVSTNSPEASREIARVNSYQERVAAAHRFAEGATGEAWDGLFLMGLAIGNLDLLPQDTMITIRWYWVNAPTSKADPQSWPSSKIIERDAFYAVATDLYKESPDDNG